MKLEKRFYYMELFEIYKSLLSKKQVEYFTLSYLEDKSFSEISVLTNVSRSAVHNTVKITVNELLKYEKNLNLYKKKQMRLNLYNNINDPKIKNKLLDLERK